MINRIHILGASGSGASTLGKSLARRLPHAHFDGDDYFWAEKFTVPRAPAERIRLLKQDLAMHDRWILSGAVCGWGDELQNELDLVIFLHIPKEVRLHRLQERERQRYGDAVLPGGVLYEQSRAFLKWASLYDEAGMDVRSLRLHESWLSELPCPVLRLEGDLSVAERVSRVLAYAAVQERD
ncbi:AAA family ATPase [Gorillibacterium sp. sgz5001074]|uniref:AAA family ATPase n=1 Tax=Gorillibacterium sp. sgz5001074 TaxID=3446695 RepID=UPI003F675505